MRWYEWRWYALEHRLRRIKCWFIGHSVTYGDLHDSLDPDYCRICFMNWSQETMTLPNHLNRGYVWLVLKDWRWFTKLDEWLLINHSRWLPSWWEY